MTPPLRSLALRLAVSGAFVAGCPAPASAATFSVTSRSYDVRISGTHTVDWSFASRPDRPNCAAWSLGSGRLATTYAVPRTARHQLIRERDPEGRVVQRWAVVRGRLPRFEVAQTGTWKYNNPMKQACTPCGPLSEFGACVPDPPEPQPLVCPKRKAVGVIDLTYYARAKDLPEVEDFLQPPESPSLLAEVRYQDDDERAFRCLPQGRGEQLPLRQPAALVVPMKELARLRPGRTATFRDTRSESWAANDVTDGCGGSEGNVGMYACATTSVKLVVQRIR